MDDVLDLARFDARAALRRWAARRDRLPADRADLLAAAWWSGNRNVAELARAADVSRDTVYGDLRSRGIDPADRHVSHDGSQPAALPLAAPVAADLAAQMSDAVAPAMLADQPTPLARMAWSMSSAMYRVAELLAAETDGQDTLAGLAEDLVARLRHALDAALAHQAAVEHAAQLSAAESATHYAVS